MRVRHITLPSVTCPAVNSLPHYLTKGTIKKKEKEKKKVIEHKMCFDILYNYSLKHYSL